MAEYTGKLRDFSEIELGAIAARAALERSGIEPGQVDHTVMGNVMPASSNAIYGARHVALKAGIPADRPALTVNRLCGSGLQSVISGSQMIQLGEAEAVLAGGMESMSQVPYVLRGARWGLRLGHGQLEDALMASLMDEQCGLYMAQTAELLARKSGISREMQDVFALHSQHRASEAITSGKLKEEIISVEVKRGKSIEVFETDDHPRSDCSLEGLTRLKPVFSRDGFVTAGNASGIVDGGAAVVVASEEFVRRNHCNPIGRIVSWGICGVPPAEMGLGPVPATHQALTKAGLRLEAIDLIEVNEAFAAQYLAVEQALHLDRSRTNVNGGAIALGHPLGATGTRLLLTLLLELRRRHRRYGLATACIGGGQGIAMIVEGV